jgi:ubiquitin-protein ligase
MVDSFTRSILMKDLAALQKNPLPFAWIPDDVLIDDNILHWQMYLIGPQDTDL